MVKIGQVKIWKFFGWSEYLEFDVTRQLVHVRSNYELTWNHDTNRYLEEDNSFAKDLNNLVSELGDTDVLYEYHKNEDQLGEFTNKFLNWSIQKKGKRWEIDDYSAFIEQGGFHDYNQILLKNAAAGRITAAIKRGQLSYDEMEESHRRMLGDILAIILYHIDNDI